MDVAKIFERIRHAARSVRWNVQTVSLLVLACCALAGLIAIQRPAETSPMDEMFGGRVLSMSELEPIEAALGNASLSTYVVRNGKLLVPRLERSQYYAELQKANCLPQAFHASTSEALNMGSFLESPRKNTQRMSHAKEQEARAAICAIEGIEDAFIFFDQKAGRPFGDETQTTAVVGVRTVPNQSLDLQAFRMIQQMLLGFRVGLTVDDITITDLKARRSLRGVIGDPNSAELLPIVKESLERQWRNKLQEVLSFVPDARINVNVLPDETGTTARAVSVAVGVPTSSLSNTASDSNEVREKVTQSIFPLLPRDNGVMEPNPLVTVTMIDPPENSTANSLVARLSQTDVITVFLVAAFGGAIVLLVLNGKSPKEQSAEPQLRIYNGDEATHHASSIANSNMEVAEDNSTATKLRAFVADDPEAAAKSLSDFIDRAS